MYVISVAIPKFVLDLSTVGKTLDTLYIIMTIAYEQKSVKQHYL